MTEQETTAFQQLVEFITRKMRMSHLYQPLMLRTLIERGGVASLRDIASAFLAHDESQIEYYTEIIKRMPGPVLTRHHLVRREGDAYRLIPDVQRLTHEQRKKLLRLCDDAVETYTGRRGRKLYDHRRIASETSRGLPGTRSCVELGSVASCAASQQRSEHLRWIISCRGGMEARTTSRISRRSAISAMPIRVPATTAIYEPSATGWLIALPTASCVSLRTDRSSHRTSWLLLSTTLTR
jgi:hypothetical protein